MKNLKIKTLLITSILFPVTLMASDKDSEKIDIIDEFDTKISQKTHQKELRVIKEKNFDKVRPEWKKFKKPRQKWRDTKEEEFNGDETP